MSNSWDPVVLPPGYSYGFTGGPAFDTRIRRMDGGGESRVQVIDEPSWKWQATRKNFGDDADVDGLLRWFLARRGALYGFLFLDARDFSTSLTGPTGVPTALDQIIGFGDGVKTRFKLRKQYTDPGGMTARTFPRRVVPLTGTASAAVARVLGVDVGASIQPAVAIDGTPDGSAVFMPSSMEVEFLSAPTMGAQVTWGGYFVTPVRFDETTDKQFDAVLAGFAADEASFGVESIQFDDAVPMVPGGSPYGVQATNATGGIEVQRHCFWFDYGGAGAAAYLPDLDSYPTGGPHHLLDNLDGSGSLIVRDSLGTIVATIATGTYKFLLVKEDGGLRTPYLI